MLNKTIFVSSLTDQDFIWLSHYSCYMFTPHVDHKTSTRNFYSCIDPILHKRTWRSWEINKLKPKVRDRTIQMSGGTSQKRRLGEWKNSENEDQGVFVRKIFSLEKFSMQNKQSKNFVLFFLKKKEMVESFTIIIIILSYWNLEFL